MCCFNVGDSYVISVFLAGTRGGRGHESAAVGSLGVLVFGPFWGALCSICEYKIIKKICPGPPMPPKEKSREAMIGTTII